MSRKPYEKPMLVKHQLGMLNKYGSVPSVEPMLNIDGVAVEELLEKYGSPLFVFSEQSIVDKTEDLNEAFKLRYPKTTVAWSYKTNYLDAICKVFHREGSWAEVVSEFEYDKAIHNGVPGSRIIFNGPLKPANALEKAFRNKSIVNLDNFDELQTAEDVAAEIGEDISIGIRVNLGTSATPPWGRFGFNLDNGQARDAVRRLLAGGKLSLNGLHCHLGTFIQQPEAYQEQTAKLALFANWLREEHSIILDYIDIGGGIASRNTLHTQYLPGSQTTPPLSRFAEAVSSGLSELTCRPDDYPTLFLETGRALIDDAGYLLTSVVANKRLPDGQRSVVIDAGVNILFTAFWYKHEIVPAQAVSGTPEQAIIHGPLCMNIDVIRPSLLFPPVEVGDKLIIKSVGAYNVTQWMQFITYRPAVVMISQSGEHALIRRAEDLSTITNMEEVPDWLQD